MASNISIYQCVRCSEEKRRSELLNNNYSRLPWRRFDDFNNSTVKRNPGTDGLPIIVSGAFTKPTERGLALSQNIDISSKVHGSLLQYQQIVQFLILLKSCAKRKDLHEGTRLHNAILQNGLLDHCSDVLVSMYASCGALGKAEELFDIHGCRDVFCWTSLIKGYVRQGHSERALELFDQMQQKDLLPDAVTFACILKACGALKVFDKGKQVHGEVARQGLLGNDVVLGTALIDMYAKCGALSSARLVLEELPFRDVVCWNSLITGYVQQGQAEQALECFDRLEHEGIHPDAMTFACVLKACGTLGAKEKGEKIHKEVVKHDLLANDIVLGNALVYVYAKCGCLQKAQQVLEKIPSRDVVGWSALISGYTEHGQAEQALKCLQQMEHEGLSPDAMIFICILKSCGILGEIDKGTKVHDEIARKGLLKNNAALGTALVDMYAKCGALSKARQVFDKLPVQNVASWNSLITAYVQHDQNERALDCFEEMQRIRVSPDSITFACILKICAAIGALEKGAEIHDKIMRQGLLGDNLVLYTALMDMYAKCGALTKAQRVHDELPYRDIISWNALIGGYTEQGHGKEALVSFKRMQEEGFSPDAVTFSLVLKACGILQARDKGAQIHEQAVRQGLIGSDVVLDTALIDMYMQCGDLTKAAQVLEGLPSADVIAWNSLISGYAQEGQGEQALQVFQQMRHEGLCPNVTTFSSALKACGSLPALDKGEKIHEEIARHRFLEDAVLGTALVDMYVKGGDLIKARKALEDLPSQCTAAWNALIAGYTKQGQGGEALLCFERMLYEGLSPDGVTLSCVLAACSHLGLVEDGYDYFTNMQQKYGVKPDVEHYSCLVDLFGRAGHLEKAVEVVQEMPSFDGSTVCWRALLGACGKWGNVTVGRWAFEQAIRVEKSDGPAYVLMANLYASAGMKENAEFIEALKVKNRASKK